MYVSVFLHRGALVHKGNIVMVEGQDNAHIKVSTLSV